MALYRGKRCSEPGCLNYCDFEGSRWPTPLCKVCRDEQLLEKLHMGRYAGCEDGRTANGNRAAEAARKRREAEDEVYVRQMGKAQVGVLQALSIIEGWQK